MPDEEKIPEWATEIANDLARQLYVRSGYRLFDWKTLELISAAIRKLKVGG